MAGTLDKAVFFPLFSRAAVKKLLQRGGGGGEKTYGVDFDRFYEIMMEMAKAYLFVVSLNPYIRNIEIPSDDSLGKAIEHCKKEGLEIYAFTCRIANDGEVYIHQHIPIS